MPNRLTSDHTQAHCLNPTLRRHNLTAPSLGSSDNLNWQARIPLCSTAASKHCPLFSTIHDSPSACNHAIAVADCSMRPVQAGTASAPATNRNCVGSTPGTQSPKLSTSAFTCPRPPAPNTLPSVISEASTSAVNKLSATQQQAEHDSKCFWLLLLIVSFAIVVRPVVCWLTKLPLVALDAILRTLLHLLEQVDDSTFVAGILLWLVFGSQKWLVASSWLKPPVKSAQTPPVLASSDDVGNEKYAAQVQQRLTPVRQVSLAAKEQQQLAMGNAPLVTLSYSPIAVVSIAPCGLPKHTSAQACSPVVVVINTAPVGQVAAATITLANLKYSVAVADMTSGARLKATTIEQAPVTSDLPEIHAAADRTTQNASITLPGTKKSVTTENEAVRITTNLFVVDTTSESENELRSATSQSTGSSFTLLSSECGGIDIAEYVHHINDDKHEDRDTHDDMVKSEIVPGLCPKEHTVVGSAELARLMKVHENPIFYEGCLDDVLQYALDRRYEEVNSNYNGETASMFTGLGTWPDRSVSGDQKDIDEMLGKVGYDLPLFLQDYIANYGLYQLYIGRDGMTGLNIFSGRLELSWHRHNPPTIDGISIEITGCQDIYNYERLRTRAHRKACPPGLEAPHGLASDYRQYLTDEQEVKVNRGSVEHVEETEFAEVCKKLQELRVNPAHNKAQLSNPVLGWLDDMEDVEFLDAYDYLACACGQKAMFDHLKFRYTAEPGYDPSQFARDASKPGFIDDEDLEEDRRRKKKEADHLGPVVGFPRSQIMFQVCELHAIPTNNLWILDDDCAEDANACLVGANNDLPVPGLFELTKFPQGSRIPRGFLGVPYEALLPRCEHGHLHPPFADHCNRCFPQGDEHKDCSECDAHHAVRAIMREPKIEEQFEAKCKEHDRKQRELARKAEKEERAHVLWQQRYAHYSYQFGDWDPVVVV